jgi:DinB superfamily
MRPNPDEYYPECAPYIALVTEEDPIPALENSLAEVLGLLHDVSDEVACRLHPPYTWTIKQVVGHLTDSERVFGYRALRFARGDTTPLPAFDDDLYARSAVFRDCTLASLAAEFELVRRSHLAFFNNLVPDDWDRRGIVNGAEISVRALAFDIAGHGRHHAAIMRRRLHSS